MGEDDIVLLESFIEDAYEKLGVPGVAVTVVENGKTVFAKGFGTREYEKDLPITEKTLFQIGSVSKMFTGYLASEAVRQGKMQWDTPISTYLPEFVTGSEEFTNTVTLKQALSMSSGFPRKDFYWLLEHRTPEEGLARMATVSPVAAPGEQFMYSNQMIASGGYAVARSFTQEGSLLEAWRNTMQEQVFDKLDMQDTTFDLAEVETSEHAIPTESQLSYDLMVMPIACDGSVTQYEPAGGIWTNMNDIGKFMIEAISNSSSEHTVRWEPVIALGDGRTSYGITSMIQYAGVPFIYHDGGICGFQSRMALIPNYRLGFSIMTNSGLGASAVETISQMLIDIIFKTSNASGYLDLYTEYLETSKAQAQQFVNNDVELTPDAAWLQALVGKYHDDDMGDIEISIEDGSGVFDAGEWKSKFGIYKDSTERYAILMDPPFKGLTFEIIKSGEGDVSELVIYEEQVLISYQYHLKKID